MLFGLFIAFSHESIRQYQRYEVVTHISTVNDGNMIFPSVTFCFVITKKRSLINRTEIPLVACRFDEIDCDKNAFRHFKLSIFHHGLSDCYTFNGGRNLNEEPEELRYQKLRGFMAGLRVFF